MKIRDIIFSGLLLGTMFLSSCHKTNDNSKEESSSHTKPISYKVNESQYNELANQGHYYENILSTNFTANHEVRNDNSTMELITKIDNGKVFYYIPEYGDNYLEFKEGTYNVENNTWTADVYYEEDGNMIKATVQDYSGEDVLLLPDIGYIVNYDEVKYNSENHCYEMIAESKVLNQYYTYTNVKVKFQDDKLIYQTYTMTDSKGNVSVNTWNYSDFGTTKVELPIIE